MAILTDLSDLAINNGDLALQANGSPKMLRAEDVITQDLRHALIEGGAAHKLVAEDVAITGVREVLRLVEADPRVRPGTAQARWQGRVLHVTATLLEGAALALEVVV